MKCICVTGAIQNDLDLVFNIMQEADIKPPLPNKHNELIDIHSWHERALTLSSDNLEENKTPFNPGRFMEQMASDIFFANIKSDIWGWADTRSALLLEHWVNFDPRINFLIVYISPQQMLANVISKTPETISVDAILSAWQTYYQQLLHFYLRNPHRSIFVDAYESTQNPQALLKHCAKKWDFPFSICHENPLPINNTFDSLALYLAQHLIEDYPEVVSLQDEITATLTRLNEHNQLTPAISTENLIKSYQALQDRSVELNKIQRAHEELAIVKIDLNNTITYHQNQQQETEQRNQLLVTLLDEVQKELKSDLLKIEVNQKQVNDLTDKLTTLTHAHQQQTQLANERQTEIGHLTQQHNLTVANHSKQRQEAFEKLEIIQQENELLLLQLHQAQTERETYLLQNEAKDMEFDCLATEVNTLNHSYRQQSQLLLERQTQIEQLTRQYNVAVTNNSRQQEALEKQKTIQQENELLLLQLNQAQAEREAYLLQNETKTIQIDSLVSEVNTINQSYQHQSQLLLERQTQIEQLTKQYNVAVTNNSKQQEALEKQKTIQQENELLLLQLHQVQEEFEHYLLQHQSLQQQLQDSETTLQRMLERNHDYCDYETLEVFPVANETTSSNWQLKNLTIAGRYLPHLTFKLILEQGMAGFVFKKLVDNNTPFIRWPAKLKNDNEVTIILVGEEELLRQRIGSLIKLSVSDWNFINALCCFLEDTLKQPQAINLPAELDLIALSNGLKALKNMFDKLPILLRYDQLSIKQEQINSDYQYLWLHIANLSYDDKLWPEFEFRLSCTNILQDSFGAHPKLEFPEVTAEKVLESWFIESYDDFGAKMELRFAMPTSMNHDVWQRLSENDKKFIKTLISYLPVMLTDLQGSNQKIKRPWKDWIVIAKDMLLILTSLITQPVLTNPEPISNTPKFADSFKANITYQT